MAHARVEELSDSDPEEMDIGDLQNPAASEQSLITPADIPFRAPPSQSNLLPPKQMDEARTKKWQCLYPIYFDSRRSRAEGRRVGKEQAVPNPLAREIVDAVQGLGLNVVFEPSKTHPKDWANPGRVRILLKEDGKQVARNIKNKHQLYHLVSGYLQSHPTTESSPMRLRIPGMPPQAQPPPPPAVPKGWKIGSILPLHSAAVSGGGVSENMFKDMMAEMQGQSGEAAGPANAGSLKPKKEKKKAKT